ncbi:MAG: formyltransferase family protein [Pseudomonadota bacterium]
MSEFDLLYICTDNNATSRAGLENLHKAGFSCLVIAYELPHLRYDPKQPEELYCKPLPHRKRWLKDQSSTVYCHAQGIPYFLTHETDLDSLLPLLRALQFDYVLINEWSAKLSMDIARLAKIEAMNCHPSFLPEYRGGNITYAPLINGETDSGLTVHVLTEKFDAGKILARRRFPIAKNETTVGLTFKRSLYVGDVLLEALEKAGRPSEYLENPESPFWYRQSRRSYVAYRVINWLRRIIGLRGLRRSAEAARWLDRL